MVELYRHLCRQDNLQPTGYGETLIALIRTTVYLDLVPPQPVQHQDGAQITH